MVIKVWNRKLEDGGYGVLQVCTSELKTKALRLKGDLVGHNTRQYQGVPGSTRQYQGVPGGTRGYQGVPGGTRGYQGVPGSTRRYWAIPGGAKQDQWAVVISQSMK